MRDWEDIVKQMLGLGPQDAIPFDLFALLSRTDALCAEIGAGLHSRQVIALAVALWESKEFGE